MTNIVISKGHDFNAIKDAAKARIDKKAEAARARILTPILGQEYIYSEKYRQATDFLADETQDEALFPFLTGEAQVSGQFVRVCAQMIVARKQVSDQRLSMIEVIRLQAKKAVSDAENKIAIIDEIVNTTDFPSFSQ